MLEFFPNCLEEHASSSKPLVLVLDSLDQLSDDDAGRELDWLPKQLPDDVYIVLSALPGDEYVCLPKLQVLNESNCSVFSNGHYVISQNGNHQVQTKAFSFFPAEQRSFNVCVDISCVHGSCGLNLKGIALCLM